MQKQELVNSYSEQEDKLFASKMLDKINTRDQRNNFVITDFLNLHEKAISKEILSKNKNANYLFFGGYEDAERTVLILYPNDCEIDYVQKQFDCWVTILRITLPKYNEPYSHREYLGGIMKLGVKREKIGDIIVLEDGADIIVKKEIAQFLKDELEKLTRFRKATIEQKSIYEIRNNISKVEEATAIIPSYRIDAVISEVLKLSRSKSSDIIDEERVFVNGALCKNGAKYAKIGDKITVRGKGRFEISEELGCTKKENIKIKVVKYL